jgi:hypothetical protein
MVREGTGWWTTVGQFWRKCCLLLRCSGDVEGGYGVVDNGGAVLEKMLLVAEMFR